jgi:hypothetical protein
MHYNTKGSSVEERFGRGDREQGSTMSRVLAREQVCAIPFHVLTTESLAALRLPTGAASYHEVDAHESTAITKDLFFSVKCSILSVNVLTFQ